MKFKRNLLLKYNISKMNLRTYAINDIICSKHIIQDIYLRQKIAYLQVNMFIQIGKI